MPPTVPCSNPKCKGSCPLRVVVRSNRPDGIPAFCYDCGKVFKLKPGQGDDRNTKQSHKQNNQQRGDNKSGDTKLMAEMRRELEELRKQVKGDAKPGDTDPDKTDETSKELEQLRKHYNFVKATFGESSPRTAVAKAELDAAQARVDADDPDKRVRRLGSRKLAAERDLKAAQLAADASAEALHEALEQHEAAEKDVDTKRRAVAEAQAAYDAAIQQAGAGADAKVADTPLEALRAMLRMCEQGAFGRYLPHKDAEVFGGVLRSCEGFVRAAVGEGSQKRAAPGDLPALELASGAASGGSGNYVPSSGALRAAAAAEEEWNRERGTAASGAASGSGSGGAQQADAAAAAAALAGKIGRDLAGGTRWPAPDCEALRREAEAARAQAGERAGGAAGAAAPAVPASDEEGDAAMQQPGSPNLPAEDDAERARAHLRGRRSAPY